MDNTTTGITISLAVLMMTMTALAPVAFADPGASDELANDTTATPISLETLLGPDDDDDDDDDRRPCRPHCRLLA